MTSRWRILVLAGLAAIWLAATWFLWALTSGALFAGRDVPVAGPSWIFIAIAVLSYLWVAALVFKKRD